MVVVVNQIRAIRQERLASVVEKRKKAKMIYRKGSKSGHPIGQITVVKAFLAALFSTLLGCAPHSVGFLQDTEDRRLEVLTSFSTALNARNYQKAVGLMCPEDQFRILNAVGEVPEEYREKLRALHLSTLNNNPAVTIVHGKIDGLFELLPVLDQGPVADSGISAFIESKNSASIESKTRIHADVNEPISKPPKTELRIVTTKFFNSVRVRQWSRALDYLDEGEKKVFEQGNGKLRLGTRRRLAAVDTSSWDALTLKDGKLTGLVLIVPPLSSIGSMDKQN